MERGWLLEIRSTSLIAGNPLVAGTGRRACVLGLYHSKLIEGHKRIV